MARDTKRFETITTIARGLQLLSDPVLLTEYIKALQAETRALSLKAIPTSCYVNAAQTTNIGIASRQNDHGLHLAQKPMIPLDQCQDRHLYRVDARTLSPAAVFCQKNSSFFGIRTKFGYRFIDEEYHWECPAYATVRPLEDLGETAPDGVKLTPYIDTVCQDCGAGVHCTPGTTWQHNLEPIQPHAARPAMATNIALERWLFDMEARYCKGR